MKPFIQTLFFILLSTSAYTQNLYLKINGSNALENKTIDSISYTTIHPNTKSLFNEIKILSEKLSKEGYIDNKIVETKKANDSTYISTFELKNKIKRIHIYIGKNNSVLNNTKEQNDTIAIPYNEIENYLKKEASNVEKSGFALSKIKLENIQRKNSTIYADLNIDKEKKRAVNSIILNYANPASSDFFPKGHLKQLNKKYLNKTFNQEILKQLYEDINSFEFVSQIKYPEILFTNDSTKIYTYIEKRKANTFDGFIGFSNNEDKKVTLNGYLDILLVNTLHAGEQFSLYWKSDGNQQRTFNTRLEIPYIFKTPLAIKAQLNIFKQDSTFQNTKTAIDLGYLLNYNSKIYLGYQETESSDIQNTNNSKISDFKNSFITTNYEYKKTDYENNLFPQKSLIHSIIGYGKRNTNNSPETAEPSSQFYTNINFAYNIEFNKKNYIYISPQLFYLKSDNYISNELFRFGGMNSIRGFSENSLQGNSVNLLLTEYRFLANQNLYLHSILDYGLYQDQTSPENKKFNNLLSIGIGAGILTSSGLLKLTIANGTTNNSDIKFYNSILSLSYNVKF
ncbi:ShlB/FhaC/HecB family hemolysin secretion/activation protein [Flavobacterium ginsengiterrae]|uniref:Membrane protein n=1 Tax=Flavobacterium ginsengiterrae TaxID=871695 RepID=A0ABP7H163_9FLAO